MTKIEVSDKAAEVLLGLLFYVPRERDVFDSVSRAAAEEAKAALIAALNEKVAKS